MITKMLTRLHMMVNTWWSWHICKGEVIGVDTDQVGEEKKKKSASYGCLGVRSCNLTRSQITAIVVGGTATPCPVHRQPCGGARLVSAKKEC